MRSDPTTIAVKILFVLFILFVPLIIWEMNKSPSPRQTILKEARAIAFHGKIDSIYFDKYNHNAEYLLLSDGVKYPLYEHWQFRVKEGDSIAKDTGDLVVHVFRRNGTKDILDYKELIKIYN